MEARTVAEHRLRHLSTDDASPTINSSRRNQWAPTDEQAKQAFREALRCGKAPAQQPCPRAPQN
eukprot:2835925-Amphidinium_carterae.1